MAENTVQNETKNVDTSAAEQIINNTPAPAAVTQASTRKKDNKFLAWVKAHKSNLIWGFVSALIGAIGFVVGILFERRNPDPTTEAEETAPADEPQFYDLTPADTTKELEDSVANLDFPNSTTEEG